MKTKVIFLLYMIVSLMVFGQEKQQELMEVKVTAPKFIGTENVTEFLNGEYPESIGEYLVENFVYPDISGINVDKGIEIVQFTITPTGNLINFEIINSVSYAVDDEIIRVLKTTDGRWKPGYNNGEPVPMEKEISLAITTGKTDNYSVRKEFLEIATGYYRKGNKMLLIKGNPKRALRSYDNGIRYMPYEKNLFMLRGFCHYELGNIMEARKDWSRLKKLGGQDLENTYLTENVDQLKGFSELVEILSEKK